MIPSDQRPDANSVSHEAVAAVAQQRAGDLYQQLILRDAKIGEQQTYIAYLEGLIPADAAGQPDPGRGPEAP